MRILVLGAGGVGGYFGGRLVQAGIADVTFLVRPARRAQLAKHGLVIESPAGNFARPVQALGAEELRPGWDLVLLTAKAYDLESAIAAVRPAVDGRTAVLPVLNGMSHIETLHQAFGAPQVMGGLAQIQATLGADGTVRHLASVEGLQFGELDGTVSDRARALAAAFAGTSVRAAAVEDIVGAMWAKLVFLGTLAIATVLMRANLGEIYAAPGGQAWVERVLDRNLAIAAAVGHPVDAKVAEGYRKYIRETLPTTASMLRDLEGGGAIEADHILGYLLQAARQAGVDAALHETAYLHAKAYEARREANRLPQPAIKTASSP